MLKQKNKIFIGIAILFFIILVYVSLNRCVVHFLNEELQLQKIDFEDYNYDTHVFFYLNPFVYEDDNLFETMCCTGWAFIPSTESSDEKQTFLILKGRKGSYITAGCGGIYDDIHNTLKEWKDVPGNDNQFNTRFSTVNLPDDIYDIYIYVENGEDMKGISPTNYAFKKEGVHLYDYALNSKVHDELEISSYESDSVTGWMTVSNEPGYVKVGGWATVDSIPSEDTEYFVVFEGNNGSSVTVEAVKNCRTDVVKELNDIIYTESGYACGIESDRLPDDIGRAYLVIQSGDKYYKSEEQEFCTYDKTKYLEKVNFNDYESLPRAYAYVNPIAIDSSAEAVQIRLNGWAFVPTTEPSEGKVTYLILKGQKNSYRTSTCLQIEDDILTNYKDWKDIPDGKNQFSITLFPDELPNDVYEVYLYVEENTSVCGIVNSGQSFKKDKKGNVTEYLDYQVCNPIDPSMIENQIDYGWITVSNENEFVKVNGWNAVDQVVSEEANYYATFIGDNGEMTTIQLANICRADVVDALEDFKYMLSGYNGGVSYEKLPVNPQSAFVIMEYDGKYFKSDEVEFSIE